MSDTDANTSDTEATISEYKDDDLVYVDPDTRKAVGLVQFDKNGSPVPLEWEGKKVEEEEDSKKKFKRKRRKRYYPWGSYKTLKKLYRLEGKVKEAEGQGTFEEILHKALNEPYWD